MANTPNRTIRVPGEKWQAAQVKAQSRGEKVTDVLTQALDDYLADTPTVADLWDAPTMALLAEAADMWARVVEDEQDTDRLSRAATQLRKIITERATT